MEIASAEFTVVFIFGAEVLHSVCLNYIHVSIIIIM